MYTIYDLKDKFESMTLSERIVLLDYVDSELIYKILYHYPHLIGEHVYLCYDIDTMKVVENIVPDMTPPTEKEVLDSIDEIIYWLEEDEFKYRINSIDKQEPMW